MRNPRMKPIAQSGLMGPVFLCVLAFSAFAFSKSVSAQSGPDGKTKELVDKIKKELDEINRLLNRASNDAGSRSASAQPSGAKEGSGSQGSGSQGKGVEKSLRSTLESQDRLIKAIDDIIQMAQKSGKSGSSGQSQPKPNGQDQKNQQKRPDGRMQEGPEKVEQKDRQGGKKPDSPKMDQAKGKKVDAKKAAPKGATEKLQGKKKGGSWGELPSYLQGIFKRGGRPEVPAKYKRFEREFYKNANKKK